MLQKSKHIYDAYEKVTPGGVQSNFRFEEPHPVYFSRAFGSHIWDVDGNDYVDYLVGYGAIILGHNDPNVKRAVIDTLENGLTSGVETELSYSLSDMLSRMIPSAEMVRFANSGTEAVMHAIMMTRAYTGKNKVVKVEGAYHGWYDQISFSHYPSLEKAGAPSNPKPVANSNGLDSNAVESMLVVPFNDVAAFSRVIHDYQNDIAAVLIEPVCFNIGAVLPKEGYLQEVRDITAKSGVPLVFDEIITGFRISPGGAQERFKIEPDLSVFGKAMGNGFPISAVVGRKEIMNLSRPGGKVAYAGTYNGNQICVAASYATLSALKNGSIQKELQDSTEFLQSQVRKISEDSHLNVRLQGLGGQFQIYFTDQIVVDYRTAVTTDASLYRKLREQMKRNGVLFHHHPLFHHGITKSHTKQDIDALVNQLDKFMRGLPSSELESGLRASPTNS
jgi:glutamate-1-semialdehyde 2,1-aminomutase